jgi:hypothetical protein
MTVVKAATPVKPHENRISPIKNRRSDIFIMIGRSSMMEETPHHENPK